jgi:hypothetical protein
MIRLLLLVGVCVAAQGHDIITTNITWDREILRIIYARCASCHRPDGTAFSLMTYNEARPWAVAIKEETLERRMPPWGAVKGFGAFHDDQALTPEQLELITSWVDGGVPEGEEKDLPKPPEFLPASPAVHPKGEIAVSGDFKLKQPLVLDGLWPRSVPDNASVQITAEFPDGSLEPLLWLKDYKKEFGHVFLLRTPLELPAGTVIRGVPPDASVGLLPAGSLPEHEHSGN